MTPQARNAIIRYAICSMRNATLGSRSWPPIRFLKQSSRDGEVARALNLALHTLSVHSGMEAISEGERIKLNFTRKTEALIRALSLLGVDRDATLPSPPWSEPRK